MAQNRYYSSVTKQTVTTVDPGAAGVTLTVADTSSYSGLDSTFPYTLAINWSLGDQELVSCTARPSGTTFTVTRGVGGTTAQPHATGATVFLNVYDADFTEAAAHRGSNATPTVTGVHGVTGNVVGTTDTQTLSGKTLLHAVASYTANHTATSTEEVILASAASGAVTITLPTAAGVTGQSYTIKRTDTTYANAVTVATTSSQTIDGATTFTKLWVQYAFVQVVSDGSNWQIIDASMLAEPWQQLSLNAAVAQGSGNGVNGFFYRRTMDNGLECAWDFKCNATSGNIGSAALPAAYRVATEQNVMTGEYSVTTLTSGFPHLDFTTAGQIALQSITSTSVNPYGHVKLDLGVV